MKNPMNNIPQPGSAKSVKTDTPVRKTTFLENGDIQLEETVHSVAIFKPNDYLSYLDRHKEELKKLENVEEDKKSLIEEISRMEKDIEKVKELAKKQFEKEDKEIRIGNVKRFLKTEKQPAQMKKQLYNLWKTLGEEDKKAFDTEEMKKILAIKLEVERAIRMCGKVAKKHEADIRIEDTKIMGSF